MLKSAAQKALFSTMRLRLLHVNVVILLLYGHNDRACSNLQCPVILPRLLQDAWPNACFYTI